MAKSIGSRDNGDGTYWEYTDDGVMRRYRFSDGAEIDAQRMTTSSVAQNNATKLKQENDAKEKELKAKESAANKNAAKAKKDAEDWDKQTEALAKLAAEARGLEKWKVQQQLKDAQRNRDNAWKIAQYQTDVQAQVQRERLAFDQKKQQDDLMIQQWTLSGRMGDGSNTLARDEYEGRQQQWKSQLGLDAVKTAAQLAQNPLNWFEAGAFYDEAAKNGYVGDAVGTLQSTLSSGGGSNYTPATNSLQATQQQLLGQQPTGQAQPIPAALGTTYSYAQAQQEAGLPTQTVAPGQPPTGENTYTTMGAESNPGATVSTMQPSQAGSTTTPASLFSPNTPSPYAPNTTAAATGGELAPTGLGAAMNQPMPAALSYTPSAPASPSMSDQRTAFANEAARLAQTANQWEPQFWQSLNPTKQKLLQSAWKSKGLNPEDILFKAGVTGLGNEDTGRVA